MFESGGPRQHVPCALTVAGSDSGGGAGLQADIKTFAAHGVFGACAVTAVTAQDTRAVHAIHAIPPETVVAQCEAVLGDLAVSAVKTGMLGGPALVTAVSDCFERRRVGEPARMSGDGTARTPLVVDPVMIAKGGAALLTPEAMDVVRERLVPLATLLTPNLPEAATLLGSPATEAAAWSRARREDAGNELRALGAAAVLLKGGHAEGDGDVVADVLIDDGGALWLEGPRIETTATHGTGCALSAAITARLATGHPLRDAASLAREWLADALRAGLHPGHGLGSPGHLQARPR